MTNEELFDKYLSDTLTVSEEQELYDLLQNKEQGRQLVEYSLEMFTNIKTADDILKGNTSKERTELIQKYKEAIPFSKYLIIATLIAAVITISIWLSHPTPVNSIEVSRVGEKANVIHGGSFQIGDNIKTEKPTHFEFMDGSKIKLTGEVLIKNEKLIYLKSGSITVNAVPQGIEKLKVQTDKAIASVLGTSFTLQKIASVTSLEVSAGKVFFEYAGVEENISTGFGAICHQGKIISSSKGLKHAKYLVYKSMLRSDSSLKMYTPMENADPLKSIGFPPGSGQLVSGKFVNGRNPFTRALKDGVLEIKGSEKFDLTMPCTFGVWINIANFENYPPILTKGDNAWRVQMNVNGKRVNFGFGDGKQFLNSKKFNALNKWYFLTIVCTEDRAKIYINAELENEKEIDSYNFTNDSTIMIGGNKNLPEQNFNGKIADVFILQRALSSEEVKSLYFWR